MKSNITLRPGRASDAQACAMICYEAFNSLNQRHGFPPDFPNVDVAIGFIQMMLAHLGVNSVVAEDSGRIVGSNFLWETPIAGVGPLTVDPSVQDSGIGRLLMQRVLERAEEKHFPGVRLVQAAFNGRSLSLYTRMGFDVREPLACMQGNPIRKAIAGITVRKATPDDVDATTRLCQRVHGHDRRADFQNAVEQGTALVVQRGNDLTGYATEIGFFGHAVALENSDLIALISGAERINGPGLLLPTRNGEVFRWCLAQGLRVVYPMTLMSRGLYNQPAGAFLPSILF
jgi:predicted N-acetyltransferase YhbS